VGLVIWLDLGFPELFLKAIFLQKRLTDSHLKKAAEDSNL
jgi:hypothetical protein